MTMFMVGENMTDTLMPQMQMNNPAKQILEDARTAHENYLIKQLETDL